MRRADDGLRIAGRRGPRHRLEARKGLLDVRRDEVQEELLIAARGGSELVDDGDVEHRDVAVALRHVCLPAAAFLFPRDELANDGERSSAAASAAGLIGLLT